MICCAIYWDLLGFFLCFSYWDLLGFFFVSAIEIFSLFRFMKFIEIFSLFQLLIFIEIFFFVSVIEIYWDFFLCYWDLFEFCVCFQMRVNTFLNFLIEIYIFFVLLKEIFNVFSWLFNCVLTEIYCLNLSVCNWDLLLFFVLLRYILISFVIVLFFDLLHLL